jgi:uncharacterized protein YfaS (alpha-2-macroglobulin family)
MGAYSGTLETLLAIGGGDDIFDDTAKETQRFKPLVRYFAPVTLKAGEKHTEEFTLPPYIGAVRIMVLAASTRNETAKKDAAKRAYGTAEKSVTVASDLMVFQTVPRFLSPLDEALIPVTVAAYKAGIKSVTLDFAVKGASIADEKKSAVVNFDKTGEKVVNFKIKAGNLPSSVELTATAKSSGKKTAVSVVEFSVRSTEEPIINSDSVMLAAGKTWDTSFSAPGQDGTNNAIIEISRLPSFAMESRLDSLVSYPHGCVEQTTSAVFPQLYLNRVMQIDSVRLAKIRTNIIAGIERILSFQTQSGGFAYWPGGTEANDWGTTYAGHFLLEARRSGYTVPSSAINNWVAYQKIRTANWNSSNGSATDQAYRLYTLSLSGNAEIGAMNRLRETSDHRAKWRLAAAYWYAGQREAARDLVKGLSTDVSPYRELSGTYGSALRDKAMILEASLLINQSENTMQLLESISTVLSSKKWLSTQETAYCLIAVAPIAQNEDAKPLSVEIGGGGKKQNVTFTTPVTVVELGKADGTQSFSARNTSDSILYIRAQIKGVPKEGHEPALRRGLNLEVEYLDIKGQQINPDKISLGSDIEVRVKVTNTLARDLQEIALVHPIPASWEIVNTRLTGSNAALEYQDIRDDRVQSYLSLDGGASKTITFIVNKVYTGSFFRPAIRAYPMYDEEIYAIIPGVRSLD